MAKIRRIDTQNLCVIMTILKHFLSISYLTKDLKCVLNDLPTFSIIVQWGKQLKDVLNDFTFMNLLIYMERTNHYICSH